MSNPMRIQNPMGMAMEKITPILRTIPIVEFVRVAITGSMDQMTPTAILVRTPSVMCITCHITVVHLTCHVLNCHTRMHHTIQTVEDWPPLVCSFAQLCPASAVEVSLNVITCPLSLLTVIGLVPRKAWSLTVPLNGLLALNKYKIID
jgi:hypothetical protein